MFDVIEKSIYLTRDRKVEQNKVRPLNKLK